MTAIRCSNCGGPFTLRGGTDDKIVLPSATITLSDKPPSFGYVTEVHDNGWCADCIRAMDEAMGLGDA